MSSQEKSDDIKHKIRKLKKLEIKIRFPDRYYTDNKDEAQERNRRLTALVWDEFFDLHEVCKSKVKYTISDLVNMSKDEIKEVISEYFYYVYFRYYKENGITEIPLYDPEILAQLGLPFNADSNAIKKKFRELAKKYHPDTGGDSDRFIQLMENYRRLI